MRKLISTTLVLAAISVGVFAQEQTPANPNAPKFEFKDTQHNFGKVEEGTRASHDFVFTNTGKEPLILTNVKASCGCTTPSWPREPILPGKTGTIKVVYNSKGRPGKFNKSITISSNASEPMKVVYIRGEVVPVPGTNGNPMKEAPMMQTN